MDLYSEKPFRFIELIVKIQLLSYILSAKNDTTKLFVLNIYYLQMINIMNKRILPIRAIVQYLIGIM